MMSLSNDEWRAKFEESERERSRRTRDLKLKRTYGITLDQWEQMFEEQGGMCSICLIRHQHAVLCVDHDHRTGQVRGLVCDDCNKGLGLFGDNPLVLRRAAEYLSRVPIATSTKGEVNHGI